MLRLVPVLLFAVVAGCGWDAPVADVRVVSSGGAGGPASAEVAPGTTTSAGGEQSAGGELEAAGDPAAQAAGGSDAADETSRRPDADGRPALPTTAAVIGDSIARSAQDVVTTAIELHGVEVVAYDARESRRMAEWGGPDLPSGVAAAQDVVDARLEPELWIVALGTNDVGAGTDQATVEDDIAELLAVIPDDAPVIWVDTWVRDLDDRARVFNLVLRSKLADRPNSWVLDWHDRAAEDGLVVGDGVHLTERGRLEYARLIGSALREQFDRRSG